MDRFKYNTAADAVVNFAVRRAAAAGGQRE